MPLLDSFTVDHTRMNAIAETVIAAGIQVNKNDELALPESMLNELKVH